MIATRLAARPFASSVFAAIGFCALLLSAAAPARAADDAGASAFISGNVEKGIAILRDKSLSLEQQRQGIRGLLSTLLDTRKIGLFALGPARDKASPADLDAYVTAFNSYMIESYVMQLSDYGGQSLKVTGVIDHAPGDYVVTAVMIDPNDPGDPNPPQVAFRVLDEDGKFAVVDASIAGVWLGQAQRADFEGYLGQHNGSVPELTAYLKQKTASFDAGAK